MRSLGVRGLLAAAALLLVPVVGTSFSSGPAAASARSEPVNVGLICSCSGPLGPAGVAAIPGFEAWVKYQNAHGGLNGHPIRVFYKNDASNPGTAAADVQAMISQNHIVMLFDDSQVDSAFAKIIDQNHIPVTGGTSDSDEFLSDPNWFAQGATVDSYFIAYMEAAKKVGAHVVGQLYCAESSICQEGVPAFRAEANAFDLKVGIIASISASAPNYTAECLAAKQNRVQLFNIADIEPVTVKVAQECTTQGYDPYYVAGGGAINRAFPTLTGLKNHFIGFEEDIPYFATSVPGVKTYLDAMKKYEPATLKSPNYAEPTIQNWIAGLLLAKAVQAVNAGKNGPITATDIYNGLYSFHGQDLGGMAPPLTYTKGQANPIHCWFWIKAQGNKFTTPYGLKPACGKPVG